jgi:hypothetical protein
MGQILASDWNNLQTTIANVLGAPSGTVGWNRTVSSAQVSGRIYGSHWNALRTDVNTCALHITGGNSLLTTRDNTYQITQSDLTAMTSNVNYAYTNRLTAANTQLTQALNLSADSGTISWSSQFIATGYTSWANATQFKLFWNSGGNLQYSVSRYGGSATPQNSAWSSLLTSIGSIVLGPTSIYQSGNTATGTLGRGGGGATNGAWVTDQSAGTYMFFITIPTSPYNSSSFYITFWTDTGNYATATRVYYGILLDDPHVGTAGGPDTIDGNFAIAINQYYPYTYSANGSSTVSQTYS